MKQKFKLKVKVALLLVLSMVIGLFPIQVQTVYAQEEIPAGTKFKVFAYNKDGLLQGKTIGVYKGENKEEIIESFILEQNNKKELQLEEGVYTFSLENSGGGITAADVIFKVDGSGNVFFKKGNEWDKVEEVIKYEGYNNYREYKPGDPFEMFWNQSSLYIKPKVDGQKWSVAYCFNKSKKLPPVEGETVTGEYSYKKLEEDAFLSKATNPRIQNNDDLVKAIKKVIYYGYPNRTLGIADDLSDDVLRHITQEAVWYYTDSSDFPSNVWSEYFNRKPTEREKQVFQILTSALQNDLTVPSNFRLNVFESSNPEYQNLLNTEFVPGPEYIPLIPIDAIRFEPVPSIHTMVEVNGVTGSVEKEAVVNAPINNKVLVKDTIYFENLKVGTNYNVNGKLMNVPEIGDPVCVAEAVGNFVAEKSTGSYVLEFPEIELQVGKKYVVYETVSNDLGDRIEHNNPDDKAQTFILKLENKGKLITTVTSGGKSATSDQPLKLTTSQVETGVLVKDIVSYENLIAGTKYSLTGTLMHVSQDGLVEAVKGQDGNPISVTKEVEATQESGQWEIDFGTITNLEIGEKYVVYEKAMSKEKYWQVDQNGNVVQDNIIVSHEDKDDKAQTILAGRQRGRLRTTVTADGQIGQDNANASVSIEAIKKGVTVKDTVAYENLMPDGEYELEGTLVHIADDGKETVVAGPVKKVVFANHKGESAQGEEWIIDFGTIQGLKTGEKYVVYEVATLQGNGLDEEWSENKVVEHKDPTDKAQTFVIELQETDGVLRTTVSVDEEQATQDKAVGVSMGSAKEGVHVCDTIFYTNLAPKETYEVQATLMHVPNVGEITPVVGYTNIIGSFVTSETGDGEWTVDFGIVKDLEVGEKYVVYEVATSVNPLLDTDKDGIYDKQHVVRHENPTDKAQTVVVDSPKKVSDGILRTTVTADNQMGTETKEATLQTESDTLVVQVKDTVTYTNLVPNENYKLEATLVHVSKTGIVPVTGTSIVLKTDKSGSGQWEVDFGLVEGLKVGEKYVIYEVATSEQDLIDTDSDGKPDAKDWIEHRDPSDKSQTIVIEKPVIPSIPSIPSVPSVPSTPEPTPEPDKKEIGGTLRTTIVVDGQKGSDISPVIITDKEVVEVGMSVKDTVYYKGLVPNEDYILEGTLMHIVDGKAKPVEGAYKRQFVTASNTGNGQWEVNFGVVKGLQIGEKYVVYEKATSVNLLEDTDNDKKSDTKHIITHENPNDTAQTLLLKNPEPEKPEEPKEEKPTTPSTSNNKKKGSLRTTVVAANQTGASDKAVWVPSRYEKTDTNIKDIVYYTNLVSNAKYELEATLMHVRQDGTVTPVRGATVKQIVVADRSGNGVWEVDFGVVRDLVKEEKYVVYEKATSVDYILDTDRDDLFDSKHIVVHQNPKDLAQTIVIKSEKAVDFYLKGKKLSMEQEMGMMGHPGNQDKKDPKLGLFGKPQPNMEQSENKEHINVNKKQLPQTGSIVSTTFLLILGVIMAGSGIILIAPRRLYRK